MMYLSPVYTHFNFYQTKTDATSCICVLSCQIGLEGMEVYKKISDWYVFPPFFIFRDNELMFCTRLCPYCVLNLLQCCHLGTVRKSKSWSWSVKNRQKYHVNGQKPNWTIGIVVMYRPSSFIKNDQLDRPFSTCLSLHNDMM